MRIGFLRDCLDMLIGSYGDDEEIFIKLGSNVKLEIECLCVLDDEAATTTLFALQSGSVRKGDVECVF